MHTPHIIIAGGGIAGLASALALGGHDALILEQAEAFSAIGAGLQLGPNAVRALQKLGAWDAVEPITSSPPEIHLRDGLTGKLLKRLPLGAIFENRYGAPYRVAHRADLHAALLSVVKSKPNITMRLKEKISSVDVHLDGLTIQSNAKPMSCQALIVTDGVKSTIRENLFPNTAAIASGHQFHRALISAPHIAGVAMDCVNVWMYPSGHVVHYTVGKTQHLNIVAITPNDATPKQHFSNATPRLSSLLYLAEPDFTSWPGLVAPKLGAWTRGNVLLLGDAAHGTLPYLAQGAAMALEDAEYLQAVLPTTHSLRHAFAETAQGRMARTERLSQETRSAGKIYHFSGPIRLARNVTLKAIPPIAITRGLDWLYNG
jgi:salicylate hydroxylase